MEYDDSETAKQLSHEVQAFMNEEVIPTEKQLERDKTAWKNAIDSLRNEAQERDIYAPQTATEHGGQGLDFRDVLPAFEQAGRSLLGPPSLRVDAPDEGNMHTLEMVGSEDQKEKWLDPLVAGEIVSAFAMTEPSPGGGSDPKMIRTTATKNDGEWVINGHKWWTTNGTSADFYIVMARTNLDAHPYQGCSLILVPADIEGITVKRDIPHLGPEFGQGHAEILFEDVRVPEDNILGNEDEGFMIAQLRLGPARLTHCMRFCGMAERAIDVAKAYSDDRKAFGDSLGDKQSFRFNLADSLTDLHAARCMVRNAADQIAAGEQARQEVAMCKTFTANVVQDVIDWALQACGGSGISKDLPIADFYEVVRMFRIVDGPDEVHKRSVAREAMKETNSDELENLPSFEVDTELT